jgi:hypothetical protein
MGEGGSAYHGSLDEGMVGPGYQGPTQQPVQQPSYGYGIGRPDDMQSYTDNDHMAQSQPYQAPNPSQPGFLGMGPTQQAYQNPQGSMTPAGGKGGGGMMQPTPYQNPQGSSTPAGGKGGGAVGGINQPQQNYYQPPLVQQPYQSYQSQSYQSQPQQGYGNAYAQPYQQQMRQQYGNQQVQQVGNAYAQPYQQQYQQPFNETQRFDSYMSGILGGMPRQQFSASAPVPASQNTGNITADRQTQFNNMMDAYNQAHPQPQQNMPVYQPYNSLGFFGSD